MGGAITLLVGIALLWWFNAGKSPQEKSSTASTGSAVSATPAPDESRAAQYESNSIGMKLVVIPAGEFMMGHNATPEELADEASAVKPSGNVVEAEPEFLMHEYPQHRVCITQPFCLGVYEVTVGHFRRFVKDTGYQTEAEKRFSGIALGVMPEGAVGFDPRTSGFTWAREYSWRNVGFHQTDDHPVVNVSWNDAVQFCQWLSRKEGKTYRLPTEAEWEYACRARTTSRYYSGDDAETLSQVGNVADAAAKANFPHWTWAVGPNDGYVFTAPVGRFRPNAFGLYDMHGNVWEWCADWYDQTYYRRSPVDNPTGPDSGTCRTLRGGSWFGRAVRVRSAIRIGFAPENRSIDIGFRVARTQ